MKVYTQKTMTVFAMFVLLLTPFSCHETENYYFIPQTANQAIQGEWHLVNVAGGFAGINDDYTIGEIVWDFDTANQTVTIMNLNTNENKVDMFDSGVYAFAYVQNTVLPDNCILSLTIDGVNLGCSNFNNTQFTLSQVESDGYFITLQREPQIMPQN